MLQKAVGPFLQQVFMSLVSYHQPAVCCITESDGSVPATGFHVSYKLSSACGVICCRKRSVRSCNRFSRLLYVIISLWCDLLQKAIGPFLQQVFMLLVTTIFHALTASVDERDQVAVTERRLLRRGYFTFLSALVNNNVADVIAAQSEN